MESSSATLCDAMKSRPFFILLFLLPLACIGSETLSLDQCIQLALCNNKQVDVAHYKVEQAVAAKNGLFSYLLPELSLEGTWNNRNDSLSGDLTQFQNFKSSKAVGLSATVPLWDFLSSWNHYKASKLRVVVTEYQKLNSLLDLEERVRTVYAGVLEQAQNVAAMQSSISALEHQLNTSQQFYQEGLVKYADVLAVQVQLSDKKQQLLQAKNGLFSQKMALNQLIGRPLLCEANLVPLDAEHSSVNFDLAYTYALQHRPDLIALETQISALQCDRRGTQLSYAPKIYAFGNGNYSSSQSTVSAGIGMRMPLYEGGRTLAESKKLRSQICELTATLDDLRTSIAMELHAVCLQFEEIEQSIAMDQSALKLAEENLKNNQDLYKEGLHTIHDVLLAEEQLSMMRLKALSNRYRYYTNLARFIQLTGGMIPS